MQTGVQISSLRPMLQTEDQVCQTFRHLAGMGVRHVQLQWLGPQISPAFIAKTAEKEGIHITGIQDFFVEIQARLPYYIELNHCTGGTSFTVSRIPESFRTTDGLIRFADILKTLQDRLAPLGQRLDFHPTAPDYAPVYGITPVDLLDMQVPGLTYCLDLYHLACSGIPVVSWIAGHDNRIPVVHFKDQADGHLVPAGSGSIPWDGVVAACMKHGVRTALVEQESWDRDPFLCLGEALDWLHQQIDQESRRNVRH